MEGQSRTDFLGRFERKKKWPKKSVKSTTICHQTVSAITQARSDIFQNPAQTSGSWLSFRF